MRYFTYNVPDESGNNTTPIFSEHEIGVFYYPYWCEKMKKAGKESQICFENCLEDWITINWAWEVDKSE